MGSKGMKQATAEQREKALLIYQDTLDVRKASEGSGLSRAQVRWTLKLQGIRPSGNSGGACYTHLPKLREMLAAGATFVDVAKAIGTNHHRVSEFVRKHSIPYTPWTRNGAGNPCWRGGEVTDKDGYILVLRPDHPNCDRHGYVRKHRLVMEKSLGRHLLPS
jgi:hypothetical protein